MRIITLFRSVYACLVDTSIILATSVLLSFFIKSFFFIYEVVIFLIVAFLYQLLFSIFNKSSVGSLIVGISLEYRNKYFSNKVQRVLRVFIKFALGIIVPLVILNLIGYWNYPIILFSLLVLMYFSAFLFILLFRKSWWDYLTFSLIKFNTKNHQSVQKGYLILFVIWICFFFSFSYIHNKAQTGSENDFFGLKYPIRFTKYPDNNYSRNYAKFLSTCNLTPKDYVFSLFEKHDIVILVEGMHEEMTQWNFFYDLISDSRFINKVGNVFTEIGCNDVQNKVDSFLRKHFQNNIEREIACANLMQDAISVYPSWNGTNFFYFLTKINMLNDRLPDSLKISEHFTHYKSWDNIKSKRDLDKLFSTDYDSTMAKVIINWYDSRKQENKTHKCLVITNSVHGRFNSEYSIDAKGKPYRTEASILFEKYPGKVANIFMYNLSTPIYLPIFVFSPIENGAWDRAFEINKNRPVGFDFSNNPFGETMYRNFEPLPFGRKESSEYQDHFSGLIFDTPIENRFTKIYYPFQTFNFEKELSRRYEISFNSRFGFEEYYQDMKNGERRIPISIYILFDYLSVLILVFNIILVLLIGIFHLGTISLQSIIKRKKVRTR